LRSIINKTHEVPRLVTPVIAQGSLRSLQQPTIEISDTLQLRTWTVKDVPVVIAAYMDPDIRHWNPRSLDEHEATEVIEDWRGRWEREVGVDWAITSHLDGAVLGRIGVREMNLEEGLGEFAYWIMPGARGHGVAGLAVESVRAWAFEAIGFHRLELRHSVHNLPSCRVATKSHFELEGTLRSVFLLSDGWHDAHLHARINPNANVVV
jgi:RimJ/RimL family protein N-acetyltransferase